LTQLLANEQIPKQPTLEIRKLQTQTLVMANEPVLTDKEIVVDLLRRLPDNVSLYEIAQRLEFIAAVRQGLAEFDENKDSISIEQVERELTSWSVTVGRKRRGRRKAQRASKT
jgi:hypothetical protein